MSNSKNALTIHSFFVDIIDSIIPVDDELIFLLSISNSSDLVIVIDEVAKSVDI